MTSYCSARSGITASQVFELPANPWMSSTVSVDWWSEPGPCGGTRRRGRGSTRGAAANVSSVPVSLEPPTETQAVRPFRSSSPVVVPSFLADLQNHPHGDSVHMSEPFRMVEPVRDLLPWPPDDRFRPVEHQIRRQNGVGNGAGATVGQLRHRNGVRRLPRRRGLGRPRAIASTRSTSATSTWRRRRTSSTR